MKRRHDCRKREAEGGEDGPAHPVPRALKGGVGAAGAAPGVTRMPLIRPAHALRQQRERKHGEEGGDEACVWGGWGEGQEGTLSRREDWVHCVSFDRAYINRSIDRWLD